MELTLKRIAKKANYTIGKLYIDGTYFCDTLEDTDRGLDQSMDLETIREKKVKGHTAIPTGTYRVTLNVVSPKYSKRSQYNFCNGKVPRLLDVPGYEGILIHIGNYPKDTEGCILVGKNTKVGAVLDSTNTFRELYSRLVFSNSPIKITIK